MIFKVGDKVEIKSGSHKGDIGVIIHCGSATCRIERDDNTSIAKYYNHIKLAFTVENLKDGMICTLRNNDTIVVFKNRLISDDAYWYFYDYNQNYFNHEIRPDQDIMKINYGTETVYERNEVLKVTMKQVADAFGVDKIEVV